MQVLLVGPWPRLFSPGNFQWLSDTAAALRRLGHRVTVFRYRESWTVSPALMRRLGAVPVVPQGFARYRAMQQSMRDLRLLTLVRRLRPDLVLFLNGEVLSGEVFAATKRLVPGRMVSWWFDDPCSSASFMGSAALFDHIFIFDRSYIPDMMAAGARSVHFLPCACDEDVHRPLQLSCSERKRFACEMAFVAWRYPERDAVVWALMEEVELGVWGGGWEGLASRRTAAGTRVVRGGGVPPRTAAKIYNAAKIGLNIHAVQSRLGGLNMRTFEVLACGRFQLVDRIAGLEELLEPGREVICYGSPDEACRLAKYYLADDTARVRIATQGRARVLDEHTYVHRLRTLCELARG